MTAEMMWQSFSSKKADDTYEAWAYGCDSDHLAQLTRIGQKTATSSAYAMYVAENEPMVQKGSYHIILDSQDQAVTIIQVTDVKIIPFCEVDEDHAYCEGEGDRSLAYWRQCHQSVFEQELKTIGQRFKEDMLVVCETFQRVYPES